LATAASTLRYRPCRVVSLRRHNRIRHPHCPLPCGPSGRRGGDRPDIISVIYTSHQLLIYLKIYNVLTIVLKIDVIYRFAKNNSNHVHDI
jgi:hypothetical protein